MGQSVVGVGGMGGRGVASSRWGCVAVGVVRVRMWFVDYNRWIVGDRGWCCLDRF